MIFQHSYVYMELNKRYALAIFAILIFFSLSFPAYGQGIRGTVKSDHGEVLPFATIYFPQLNLGASTNENGAFEINLPQGKHEIHVQYIGYEKIKKQIEIGEGWLEQDFLLPEQTVLLNELEIKSDEEDPAYTIMRKAIAKRKFHLLQYDAYEATVYMKGTGILEKAPFFLKNKIEEEGGVKLNEAYTLESVSEIKFTQPNTVEERVISIHTTGDDQGAPSPSLFINESFYQDKVVNVISPLAGSAFVYYRFQYQGSFMEGDIEVNKIKVTPRSRGEQVFEGYIYIIEDLWAIHSLDLKTSVMGFQVKLKINYAEVAPKVWLPVTHRLNFSGKAFGFAGKYHFLASLSDYEVDLNEDLLVETEIIDAKVDEVPADIPEIKAKTKEKEEVVAILENEDQMTRKQFRKMINQYEKETLKARKEPEVIRNMSYSIDSLATKRDSAYWAKIRPVPLTPKEIKGYRRDDSLAQVRVAKITGKDSANVIKKGGFKLADILLGGNYNFSPRTSFRLKPTLLHTYFNTVEGLNVNVSGTLKYAFDSLRKSFSFTPVLRYGFSSEDFYATGRMAYRNEHKEGFSEVALEGGSFVSQFSDDSPIHPHINTLSTLLFRKNYMKIYEKQYAKVDYSYKPSDWLRITSSLEWGQRKALFNNNDYSFFYKDRTFTPNQPINYTLADTGFPQHEALVFNVQLRYWPVKSYTVYNGEKNPLLDRSPELIFTYQKGIAHVLGSDVDYDRIELGVDHQFVFGVSGKLEFELRGGTFLNADNMYFMDYKHFEGNRTILSSLKPAGAFRLLDYYLFSTKSSYFSGHTHYQFRKFLFTQLPEIRFSGIRENIFFNYLKTEDSPHYYEVGYSLDRIFRLLRIEVAASFLDHEYQEVGLRIGIATVLNFGED